MNLKECSIDHAVLHSPIFVANNGKGVNLNATLGVSTVDGISKGLKMTLLENFLFIEFKGGNTLVPLTSVLHMVPSKKS